jgi:arylsulfatase A-like enzyme
VASPHEQEALHWQVGEGAMADWAVRLGDWKLIGRSRDTGAGDVKGKVVENFLVDLRSDPAEQMNLAAQEPEIVQRLRRLHEEELR